MIQLFYFYNIRPFTNFKTFIHVTNIKSHRKPSIYRILQFTHQTQFMSLYQRLGQTPAITAVVQKFYEIMLQDSRVAHYFAKTDMEKQKTRQIAFISLVTGGPNLYQGTDMKTAHCKHAIGHFEFDATWDNLQKALGCFNVPQQEVSELKEIFYSVESEIVNKVETHETSLKTLKTQKSVQGKCPFHQEKESSKASQKQCPVKVSQKQCPVSVSRVEQKTQEKSLYDRLGGHGAVYLVVNKFYDIMLQDPRVNMYFANTDMEKQKSSQIEFISMVTGGPNNYGGKDMKTAHCPYKIGHMQFDSTWQNLEKAFGYFKVDPLLVNEVKEIFYSVESEIVNSTSGEVPKQDEKKEVEYQSKEECSMTITSQGIVPVTQTIPSSVQQCPHKKVAQQQYQESELMKCPHMSMKLKQIELNCHKLSECDKRKLRQEVILKEQAGKESKKLSNNPYQKTYY